VKKIHQSQKFKLVHKNAEILVDEKSRTKNQITLHCDFSAS